MNYTRATIQHGRHKRTVEMYQEVLQEREANQVIHVGLSVLQCHLRLIQAQHHPRPAEHGHHPKYAAHHNHHHWYRVSGSDN